MIYLENNTQVQDVYIPRQSPIVATGQPYYATTEYVDDRFDAETARTEETYAKQEELSAYTPTTGFTTINGSAITEGGNITIEGRIYSAGTNINIDEQNVISVTGLPDTQAVEGMVSSALTAYTDTAGMEQAISAATASTTGWVESQGYLTEHQSLSAYSTTDEVEGLISAATASTTGWVESQGYLTEHQSLSAYSTTDEVESMVSAATAATTGWVESQGYLTEHQSLSAYSTTDEVESMVSAATASTTGWVESQGYITEESGEADILLAVDELPETANIGDVVALRSGVMAVEFENYSYTITFNINELNEIDPETGEGEIDLATIPFDFSGGISRSTYTLTVFKEDDKPVIRIDDGEGDTYEVSYDSMYDGYLQLWYAYDGENIHIEIDANPDNSFLFYLYGEQSYPETGEVYDGGEFVEWSNELSQKVSVMQYGTDYEWHQIQGGGGSGNISEVTQAEYDALVSGGTVDPDTMYVITDAPTIDIDDLASKRLQELDSTPSNLQDGDIINLEDGLYKYVDGSGQTGFWSNMDSSSFTNNTSELGFAISFSHIPEGQQILEFRRNGSGNWKQFKMENGVLNVYDNSGNTPSTAITKNSGIVRVNSLSSSSYWIEVFYKDNYIGFYKNGSTQLQNLWDGITSTAHLEKLSIPEPVPFINANFYGIPNWNHNGEVIGRRFPIESKSIYFNTTGTSSSYRWDLFYGSAGNTPARMFVPTQSGTEGQVLTSAGNAEPTWQTMIKAVKITSDEYDALAVKDPNTLYLLVD